MKKLFITLGLLIALSGMVKSQDLILLSDYLKTEKGSATLGESNALSKLQTLLNGHIPTILLLQNNEQQPATGNASVLRMDISSLGTLANVQSPSAAVEAIIIKVTPGDNLTGVLSPTALQKFPALKYVYFNCEFDPSVTSLKNLLRGTYPPLVFLYAINTPS